jgi:uncharacterized RDD family membrane protein YckC
MTRADEDRPAAVPAGGYPWHAPAGAAPPAAASGAGIQGRRAGFVTRVLANVADLLVVVLGVAGCYLAVAAVRFLLAPPRFRFPAPGLDVLLLVGLGIQALYFAVTWAVVGGTYGDRLLGLRVVAGGRPRLRWGRSAVRAVLCTAFPIGLLWVLVSAGNRSVQDLLVRTSVVYDWFPA